VGSGEIYSLPEQHFQQIVYEGVLLFYRSGITRELFVN